MQIAIFKLWGQWASFFWQIASSVKIQDRRKYFQIFNSSASSHLTNVTWYGKWCSGLCASDVQNSVARIVLHKQGRTDRKISDPGTPLWTTSSETSSFYQLRGSSWFFDCLVWHFVWKVYFQDLSNQLLLHGFTISCWVVSNLYRTVMTKLLSFFISVVFVHIFLFKKSVYERMPLFIWLSR